MEEYLTVSELSERIKYSKQTLYNLIYKGTFVLGKHYLKPSPKKILFKWSEIEIWVGESCNPDKQHPSETDIQIMDRKKRRDKPKSSINI
jgi:predicted DNA-binding transcriptional regulator AlpA